MKPATLADAGIRLRDHRQGEHRTACPACARSKARPRDDALAVLIDDRGATWLCHRCEWAGALGSDRQTEPRQPRSVREPAAADLGKAGDLASQLWRRTRPITADCPAGRYLLGRGCALPHPAGDLRWVSEHRHKEGWTGPALVALVTDPVDAAMMTLHITWVQPDGSSKAPVDKPRLYWWALPKAGGVVRCWPDAELTQGLLVGEGIETVLTAAMAFVPAWACLDKGNLTTLPVLPGIDGLTIVADHDEDGGGERAAEACAQCWSEAGVEVRVWLGAEPGQDFNDLLRATA